jgi:hypothetical protein
MNLCVMVVMGKRFPDLLRVIQSWGSGPRSAGFVTPFICPEKTSPSVRGASTPHIFPMLVLAADSYVFQTQCATFTNIRSRQQHAQKG